MRPKQWHDCLLGDVTDFRNGLNFTRSSDGETIKIVGVSDFKDRSQLYDTSNLDVVRVASKVRKSDLLESGDLLFVRSNGNKELIGRCLFFPHVSEPISFSGFTIRGRVDRSKLHPQFASYLVKSSLVTSQMFLGGSGTNISNLSQEILTGINISLPSLLEQERIAQILSTWDDVIAIAEQQLCNNRKQKQALTHKLLSPKHGWKTYRLGSLFNERNEIRRGELPLLSITREEGVIPRDDVGRKDTSNDDKSKYLRICPGDIGYNSMRMWQGVSALSSLEGIVSPAYTIVVPNEKIDARFAAYLFKLPKMVFLFYRHSQGLVSDTWSLKFEHFKKISVAIPNRKDQEQIVSVLAANDAITETLNRQIEHLREERSALMQQLFTGKRRVKLALPDTCKQKEIVR